MKAKYIVFDDTLAVVFSAGITHSDMKVKGMLPTSAGFCSLYEEDGRIKANCYGASVSLDLQSKSVDGLIVGLSLNLK